MLHDISVKGRYELVFGVRGDNHQPRLHMGIVMEILKLIKLLTALQHST